MSQTVKPRYKQTEVGVIPEEWEVKTMDSLTSLMTNGFVGIATSAYVNGDDGILYIQGYNVEEDGFDFHGIKRVSRAFHARNQKSCLREGDLLTIQTGDIGVTAVVPPELVGANCHALVISRFDKRLSEPRFYCQYFNSERGRSKFKEIETGSTMKHLNVGDMKLLLLPAPPLPEQRAIATALSDVDALLAALDRLIAKQRDLKQAAMQQLLTGQTRLPGFKEKSGYKQTEVGEIPEDWDACHLADVSRKITDGDHATPQRTSHGYYLLSARNVLNGRIDVSDVDYVGAAEYQRMKQRCGPESGDILISCSGTIGRIAIVPPDFECVLVRSAALAKIDHELADSVFLQFWLQSSKAQGQIAGSVNQGAQPNLFLNHIEKLACPLPPLPEQTAIATVLSDMDLELAALEQRRDKTRALKQGMMQELLTGRTRLV